MAAGHLAGWAWRDLVRCLVRIRSFRLTWLAQTPRISSLAIKRIHRRRRTISRHKNCTQCERRETRLRLQHLTRAFSRRIWLKGLLLVYFSNTIPSGKLHSGQVTASLPRGAACRATQSSSSLPVEGKDECMMIQMFRRRIFTLALPTCVTACDSSDTLLVVQSYCLRRPIVRIGGSN
jgi:hypothetical protein